MILKLIKAKIYYVEIEMKLQNPLIDFNVKTINSGLNIETVNLHENSFCSFQLNFIDLSLNNPKEINFT